MPAQSVSAAGLSVTNVYSSVSQGAGAFLSSAIDLSLYEGEVMVIQNLGALSGAYTVPVLTASDASGGTYAAVALSNGAFGTAQNVTSFVTFNASTAQQFLKYGATVGTTALVSVTLVGFKKYR